MKPPVAYAIRHIWTFRNLATASSAEFASPNTLETGRLRPVAADIGLIPPETTLQCMALWLVLV
jgi:hypothetical protein